MRKPLLHLSLMLLAAAPAAAQTPAASGAEHLSRVENRRRLAACATEWQKMKRAGTDGSLIWREFSAACLARRK